jgi:copper transport protein
VTAIVLLVASGTTAEAHAFLISTTPAQGARLPAAPSVITMDYSGGVVSVGVTVKVEGADRPLPLTIQHIAGTSSVVRVVLGAHPDGIYVVTWHVVATDAHLSEGEFAFGAGRGGVIPVASQQSADPDIWGVAATVAFLAGLAWALGGLVTGLAVDPSVRNRSAGITAGIAVAAVGAAGGLAVSLVRQGEALTAATGATGAAVILLAAALVATRVTPSRLPPLIALLAAGVAWSTDGHAAIVGGVVGAALEAVHLTVGAVWVGTLGWFVASVVRRRRDRTIAWEVAKRYSRLALPLVVTLGVAGAISAWEVLPSWSALWTSGYGQLLLVKMGLFAAALGLAATGRWRGIGRGRAGILHRSLPLEAGVVAVIVLVTAIVANAAPPVAARPTSSLPSGLLGPTPLTGAVARDAGLAGEITVVVAAGDGQLQFQVLLPNANTSHLSLKVDATFPAGKDVSLFPRACGNGCFTQTLALPDGVTHLDIAASDPGWVGGTYHATLVWPPPPPDPSVLARVIAAMAAVPSVTLNETVSSNSHTRAFGHSQVVSGRFYVTNYPYSNGDPANPAIAPGVAEVQPLTVGGPGLTVYLPIPDEPVWVTMWVYPDGRISRARIIDVGHDIEDTFTYTPGLPAPAGEGGAPTSVPSSTPG